MIDRKHQHTTYVGLSLRKWRTRWARGRSEPHRAPARSHASRAAPTNRRPHRVQATQRQAVQQVCAITGLPEAEARELLEAHAWNADLAVASFMPDEAGPPEPPSTVKGAMLPFMGGEEEDDLPPPVQPREDTLVEAHALDMVQRLLGRHQEQVLDASTCAALQRSAAAPRTPDAHDARLARRRHAQDLGPAGREVQTARRHVPGERRGCRQASLAT
jgi:hypothetical protein